MSLQSLPIVLAPFLVVLVAAFLIYRFGFFSGRDVSGRFAFTSGSLLILLVTGYEVVTLVPDYPDWFVVGAYPAIGFVQFLAGAIGLLLVVIGLALYADYWQVRREEVEERFAKLSILENLQHDARQPYHLLELLNISLREVLVHYPLSAGAVFLVNRTRRQFVLTGSSGLRKEEIAYLEYYPLERNVVSQAVDLGDPMLASGFEFVDRAGQRVVSRFKSVLILPLASGMEKIGCLILYSEEAEFFGRHDIRYLSPVAQWLAEKIRSARLARELSQATKQREARSEALTSLVSRLTSSTRAAAAAESLDGFCRALVGLAGAESVHLCEVSRDRLVFIGGSEPRLDLSENFRAALIDGLGRARPLIINQEATDSEGSPGLVQSNLIYPLTSTPGAPSLLFIRSELPFEINDAGLRSIEGFARLAELIIRQDQHQRSRLTRRKGIDAILKLIQGEGDEEPSQDRGAHFVQTLNSALPRNSFCLMLSPDAEGRYAPIQSAGRGSLKDVESLEILPDEGGVGTVVAGDQSLFISGAVAIGRHLEEYHEQNRSIFERLFGEPGRPDLLAYCPVPVTGKGRVVVMAGLYELAESERGEWERLITLAVGLHGLRRTLHEITTAAEVRSGEMQRFRTPVGLLNQLNNHLSAVVGMAELAERGDRLDDETRRQLRQILQRAEQAADLAKQSLTGVESSPPSGADRLHRLVESELAGHHVSGDLYMAGQRPREIRMRLNPVGQVDFQSEQLRRLFQSVLNRFAALVDESDLITIATYVRDGYAYLDISRHRPNFPPVDEVANFGRYTLSSEAFRNRPADIYLRHLQETDSYYAVDTTGAVPAFLSFRFPLAGGPEVAGEEQPARVRLLAIDDQPVILDLITAMGQSLGYEVRTAVTGDSGKRLADEIEFDIVLTDLALPDISGLEVAQYIHDRRPDLPIILVTGWSTEMAVEQRRAAGIREVLHKPFRIEQLTAVVQAILRRRTSA